MTKKNNVAMRSSNDNIDHMNGVIIRISFADEAKYFLRACIKKSDVLTFLILRTIFDHLCPTRDRLLCSVFVFRRGKSSITCDLVLYLQSEGLNICDEISEKKLGKNEHICFEPLEFWVLNSSLKEETMRNIHNQNGAELVHYIIVFNTHRS